MNRWGSQHYNEMRAILGTSLKRLRIDNWSKNFHRYSSAEVGPDDPTPRGLLSRQPKGQLLINLLTFATAAPSSLCIGKKKLTHLEGGQRQTRPAISYG